MLATITVTGFSIYTVNADSKAKGLPAMLKLTFGHYQPQNACTVNADIFCSLVLALHIQSCMRTAVQ